MSDTWDVELYIYDLSQGFAAMMSEPLLGQFITGSNKPEVTVKLQDSNSKQFTTPPLSSMGKSITTAAAFLVLASPSSTDRELRN